MTMPFRFLVVFLFCIAATALVAAPAKVRSGEHDRFSRIVIDGAARPGWRLRRTADGYAFRPADSETRYDIGNIYDLIPRTRIAEVTVGAGGTLNLAVDCDCHANAFVTEKGALVIDIADGPADPGSPFEILEPAPSTDHSVATDTREAANNDEGGNPVGQTFDPLWPLMLPEHGPDSHLDLYWNGTPNPKIAEGIVEVPASEAAASPPVSNPDVLDQGSVAEPSPSLPTGILPQESRTGEMQRALLEQLGRAAAQGLVGFNAPSSESRQHDARPARDTMTAPEPAVPQTNKEDSLPLHIETSIDRDSIFGKLPNALAADGAPCPDDAYLAVGDWGDDTPPALQISAARTDLVGEFDRPDPARVTALARLFIYLGFGAEARATLRAFEVESEAAAWIDLLAQIEDGATTDEPRLATLAACDNAAALWALLGREASLPRSDLNLEAIQRSFSELPLHLRHQLGPRAIERLISADALETAAALRNAILRAGDPEEPALTVATARLAIEAGDPDTGLNTLENLAHGNGTPAEEALVRSIRLRLDRGEAVPPELAANVGALAFEHRYGVRGPELATLQVLALASTGDFATAFAAESRWDEGFPADLRASALLRLFARLASDGDDWTLLQQYFANRERLMESGPDILLRLDLAERLNLAGFASAAADLLHGEAGTTERGRLILARQALAAGDPDVALGLISSINGEEAASLRGEALLQAGQPEKAGAQFKSAGDDVGASRAAWLAGAWADMGESAPEALASSVRTLGLAESGGQRNEAPPEAELAAGRELVEEANRARGALADLISYATTE